MGGGPCDECILIILISVSFNFRTESSQLRGRRLLPLLAPPIDTDDGGHMVDDDMQALLPNNESLSHEDLNQVCIYSIIRFLYTEIDIKLLFHNVNTYILQCSLIKIPIYSHRLPIFSYTDPPYTLKMYCITQIIL